jgi:Flp pilus assembly protein TadD
MRITPASLVDHSVPIMRALLVLIAAWAALAFSAAIRATPQSATSAANLKQIQSLVDSGKIDVADKQLWEIVTREPENAPAINLLGMIRMRQERFPEAEALFKRALAITPSFASAYRNLGQLYVVQERRDDAKIAYLKAHELDAHDVRTSFTLAAIYEETGEFQRSLDILDSIPRVQLPSGALPALASDYFALKQPEKVATLAPQVRRGMASEPSLAPRFARVLLDNGFVDDAADLLKAAPPQQQTTSDYLLVLSRVQERQGNLTLAEHTLTRLSKLDPKSFDAPFQLARLASQARDYKKEAALLEKALEIQPNHLEALRHLVLARMRSDDAAKAVTDARHLYSLHPADPDALYLLGAALANHSEWHVARPIMEKLVAARDDATSRVMLGMTLLNDGDIEGASQQIEHALQQDPNELEAHYYRGMIARQRGDLSGALKEMELVVHANPQHVQAQAELGTLAMQLGDLDRARQAFEQAILFGPGVPENHYQLALAYSRLGQPDRARAQMAEFQKLKGAADRNRSNSPTPSDPPAAGKPPS